MNDLTGLKDIDREILKYIPDDELLKVCSINRRMRNDVCDDNFLRRRMCKYPKIINYKKLNETWKQFFLKFVYYTSKMREKYGFHYTDGDFKRQYELLERDGKRNLIQDFADHGELSLVKFSVEQGADIHVHSEEPLRWASLFGHLNVVKWLVENGADIHALTDQALRWAADWGHLHVVKYLTEQGADIHAGNDEALELAAKKGNKEIVEYLKSKN